MPVTQNSIRSSVEAPLEGAWTISPPVCPSRLHLLVQMTVVKMTEVKTPVVQTKVA